MPEALHKPERQRTPTKMVVVVVVVVVVVIDYKMITLKLLKFMMED